MCLWIFWCQDNYIFPAAIWPPIVLRPAFKAHGAIHFFCVLMSLTGNSDIALQTWIKSIRAKSLLFMWYKRISVGVYACFLRTTCGVSKHLVFALVKRFIFSLVVFEISSETCYFFALAQNPSRGKPVDTLGIFTPPSLWTGVENCKWGKITIGYWNAKFPHRLQSRVVNSLFPLSPLDSAFWPIIFQKSWPRRSTTRPPFRYVHYFLNDRIAT